MEAFAEIELSRSLRFLIVAVNATDRGELGEHRAYQEALHLFRVLRPPICRTAARRLAIRIKKTGEESCRRSPSVG